MKVSNTTKLALWATAGALVGYFAGKAAGKDGQVTSIIGGLIGTVISQKGEVKKLLKS